MAKFDIPTSTFEKELPAGATPTAMKAAGAEKGEIWMVPLANIRRLDDFNVRIKTPAYEAHRDEIAASIQANGFYANKPLAGYVTKEGDENVIYLTDGYTRLDASELAIERGAQIEKLPVVVKPKGDSLVDLTVALVQDNEGLPLGPFEKSIVVKRLLGYNIDKEEIARRLGMTKRYVDDLEVLAGAPPKVRNLVITGKVTPTDAVKQLRKGEGATKTLEKAVETAAAKGKKKATASDVAAAAAEGAAGPSTKTTSTKKGKTVEKSIYRLKAGQKFTAAELTPIYYVDGGDWRRDPDPELDSAAEDEVIITKDVTITLIVETAETETTSAAKDEDEL